MNRKASLAFGAVIALMTLVMAGLAAIFDASPTLILVIGLATALYAALRWRL